MQKTAHSIHVTICQPLTVANTGYQVCQCPLNSATTSVAEPMMMRQPQVVNNLNMLLTGGIVWSIVCYCYDMNIELSCNLYCSSVAGRLYESIFRTDELHCFSQWQHRLLLRMCHPGMWHQIAGAEFSGQL